MPQTRIPTQQDLSPLSPHLTFATVYPSPRESTTSILILFHGLGDSEAPFASFGRNLSLPGVLAISVRGVNPLPPSLFGDPPPPTPQQSGGGEGGEQGQARNFHWGDDLLLSSGEEQELEPDPGYEKTVRLVMGRLVKETLVEKCGWETRDVMLFGFGQGGSVALGLASRLRVGLGKCCAEESRVKELVDGDEERERGERGDWGKAFKGVVSIGGPLLTSMIPRGLSEKSRTPVLVCHGSQSDAVDEFAVDALKREFESVRVVKWKRPDDGMPRSREEVLPMMEFFAERLRSGR